MNVEPTTRKVDVSAYEDLASEYYDETRHPTCANFRWASKSILDKHLRVAEMTGALICEVGAGRSLLAELLATRLKTLRRLILLDSSPGMLDHSSRWRDVGAQLRVGDATEPDLATASIGFLFASLADPYNGPRFWSESARILKRGATLLFTTPSFEWARSYRSSMHPPVVHSSAQLFSAKFRMASSIRGISSGITSMR